MVIVVIGRALNSALRAYLYSLAQCLSHRLKRFVGFGAETFFHWKEPRDQAIEFFKLLKASVVLICLLQYEAVPRIENARDEQNTLPAKAVGRSDFGEGWHNHFGTVEVAVNQGYSKHR